MYEIKLTLAELKRLKEEHTLRLMPPPIGAVVKSVGSKLDMAINILVDRGGTNEETVTCKFSETEYAKFITLAAYCYLKITHRAESSES